MNSKTPLDTRIDETLGIDSAASPAPLSTATPEPRFGIRSVDLTSPSNLRFDADTFSPERRDEIGRRQKASIQMLFGTDLTKLDDAGVAALYQSVTEGMYGIPDTDGSLWFGTRKSADMRKNVEMLRDVLSGKDTKPLYDERAEAYMKADRAGRLAQMREDKPFMDSIKDTLGAALDNANPVWAAAAQVGMTAYSVQKAFAENPKPVAVDPEQAAEFQKAQEDKMLARYEEYISKNQPLVSLLSAKGQMSDYAGWILTKSLMNKRLDADELAVLDKDERRKVIAGFETVSGDKKSVELLGLFDADVSTGTVGDRLQMLAYGAQQAFIGLFKGAYGLGEDIHEWVYLKTIQDQQYRQEVGEQLALKHAAKAANERPLPKGGFFGEAFQTLAENWHWAIPYGGSRGALANFKKVSGEFKALKEAETARKWKLWGALYDMKNPPALTLERLVDKTSGLADTVHRYQSSLDRVKRLRLKLGAQGARYAAEYAGARAMTVASFAEEYLRTADAVGFSREQSIPMAIAVGFVNDAIEKITVPGLDEAISLNDLHKISMGSLVYHLQNADVGKYIKQRLAITLPAGARTAFTEGAVEEPLQQLVIEHAKVFEEDLDALTGKDGQPLSDGVKQMIRDQIAMIFDGRDIKTYVDTVVDMAPAAFGYLVSTGVREQGRAKLREIYAKTLKRFGAGKIGLEAEDIAEGPSLGSMTAKGIMLNGMLGEYFAREDRRKAAQGETLADKPFRDRQAAEAENDDADVSPEFAAGLAASQRGLKIDNTVARIREIYSRNAGGAVDAVMEELGLPQNIAELAVDFLAEEDALVFAGDKQAELAQKTNSFPVFNKGSFGAFNVIDVVEDKENGQTYVEFEVGFKDQKRRVKMLYRKAGPFFLKADGSIDMAEVAKQLEDDSDFGKSYDVNATKKWAELSQMERKIALVNYAKAYKSAGGTFEITDSKTGKTVPIAVDSIVNLSDGNFADLKYRLLPSDIAEDLTESERSSTSDVYHETFHGLWTAIRSMMTDDDIKELAKAFPDLDTSKEGWIDDLDERMAYQFQQYASGAYSNPRLDNIWQRVQAAAGNFLHAIGLGEERKVASQFGLDNFYQAVLNGQIGSGDLGVARTTTAQPKPNDTAKPSTGEIPLEVSDAERAAAEAGEAEAAAEETAGEPETTPTPAPQPAQPAARQAPSNDWDFGNTLKLKMPGQPGRFVVKLKVVDAASLLTSFNQGVANPYQNRDEATDEAANKVAEIEGKIDFDFAGAPNPLYGGSTLVVDKAGYLIVGNHRARAVQLAYERGGERAAQYRARVLAEAEYRGLTVDDAALAAPILIGELTEIEDNPTMRLEDLGKAGNEQHTRGSNAYEQAVDDAVKMEKTGIVSGIETRADGSIDLAKSMDAVNAFIHLTGAQDVKRTTKLDGAEVETLTKSGEERIGNAMLALLLGGDKSVMPIMRTLVEDERLDIGNEKRALVRIASPVLNLAKDRPLYDIRKDIGEALKTYLGWRSADTAERIKADKTVAQWQKRGIDSFTAYAAQQDLFKTSNRVAEKIAKLLAESRLERSFASNGDETAAGQERAIRKIVDAIRGFVDSAYKVNVETDDMFGTPPASAAEVADLHFAVRAIDAMRFAVADVKPFSDEEMAQGRAASRMAPVNLYSNWLFPDGMATMDADHGTFLRAANIETRSNYERYVAAWKAGAIGLAQGSLNVMVAPTAEQYKALAEMAERLESDFYDRKIFLDHAKGNERLLKTYGGMTDEEYAADQAKSLKDGWVNMPTLDVFSDDRNHVFSMQYASFEDARQNIVNDVRAWFDEHRIPERARVIDGAKPEGVKFAVSAVSLAEHNAKIYEASERYAGGDENASGALYEAVFDGVYENYLKWKYYNASEDAVESAMHTAFYELLDVVKNGGLKDIRTFGPNLLKRMEWRILDAMRGRVGKTNAILVPDEYVSPGQGGEKVSIIDNAVSETDSAKAIKDLIDGLDAESKQLVRLRMEGKTQVEIAKIMGIGQADVSAWMTGLYADLRAGREPRSRKRILAERRIKFAVSPVFTGSAADYEKPSLLKVGTGEGSQVYGWGLYGSNQLGVAEEYARAATTGTGNSESAAQAAYEAAGNDIDAAARILDIWKGSAPDETRRKVFEDAIALLKNGSFKPSRYVYEQTFFTDRAPGDESHLVSWYDILSDENLKRIVDALKTEHGSKVLKTGRNQLGEEYILLGIDTSDKSADGKNIYLSKGSSGRDVYEELVEAFGSPKAASEFLARADIDGIKYPVDSYGGKAVKNGNEAGWNYVSFRDDNILINHKWIDGKMKFAVASPWLADLKPIAPFWNGGRIEADLEIPRVIREYGKGDLRRRLGLSDFYTERPDTRKGFDFERLEGEFLNRNSIFAFETPYTTFADDRQQKGIVGGAGLVHVNNDVVLSAGRLALRGGDNATRRILARLAAFANGTWTVDDVLRLDGDRRLLSLMAAINDLTRAENRSDVEWLETLGDYVGIDAIAKKLVDERLQTVGHAAHSRQFKIRELLTLNDDGTVPTAIDVKSLAANGTVDYFGQKISYVDFLKAADVQHEPTAKRIMRELMEETFRDAVIAPLARSLRGVSGDVTIVYPDDKIAATFWYREFVRRGLSIFGVRVGKMIRYRNGTNSSEVESGAEAGSFVVLSLDFGDGANLIRTAEAIRSKYGVNARRIVPAVVLASDGRQLALTDSWLSEASDFGILQTNQEKVDDNASEATGISQERELRSVEGLSRIPGGIAGGSGTVGLADGSRRLDLARGALDRAVGRVDAADYLTAAEARQILARVNPKFSVSQIGERTQVVTSPLGKQKSASAVYPNAGEELRELRFAVGAKRREEYLNRITGNRPDLSRETVDAYLGVIDGYDNPKKEKLAVHWIITGAIRLPEDDYKVDRAIKTAERAKVDPFRYNGPEDILAAFQRYVPKDPPIDPDTVPELTNRTPLTHGIVVYNVDETLVFDADVQAQIDASDDEVYINSIKRAAFDHGKYRPKGQLAMRKIINSHWGKDASPWCLLRGDKNGNLRADALNYWNRYNALPKRVAFRNGKLLAFMATDNKFSFDWERFFADYIDEYDRVAGSESPREWMRTAHPEELKAFDEQRLKNTPEEWWDRKDQNSDGIPFEGPIEGDALGRSAKIVLMADGTERIEGRIYRGNRENGVYEEWINGGEALALRSMHRNGLLTGVRVEWNERGAVRAIQHPYGITGAWPTADSDTPAYIALNGSDGKQIDNRTYSYGKLIRFDQWTPGYGGDISPIHYEFDSRNGSLYSYRESRFVDGYSTLFAKYQSYRSGGGEYWFIRPNGHEVEVWVDELGGVTKLKVTKPNHEYAFDYSDAGFKRKTLSEVESENEVLSGISKDLENFKAELRERAAAILEHEKATRPSRPKIPARPGLTDAEIEEYLEAAAPEPSLAETIDRRNEDGESQPRFAVGNRKYGPRDYRNLIPEVIASTSHNHMVGHDDPYTHAKYEELKRLKLEDPELARLEAERMAESVLEKTRYIGKYFLGKHFGDLEAAHEAVRHYFNPALLGQLDHIVGTERNARWIYVSNVEDEMVNTIPLAFAGVLANRFGGRVVDEIKKLPSEHNTGAEMQTRLSRDIEWMGEIGVEPGAKYFIVDDVWTTGATVMSLAEYLKDRGIEVTGVVTVAAASNTKHIVPTEADWTKLLKKSKLPDIATASRVAGLDLNKLTGSEVYAYALKGRPGKAGLATWFARAVGEVSEGVGEQPGSAGEVRGNSRASSRAAAPLRFATAFPRVARMSDDELIVSALAAGMILNPKKPNDQATKRTRYGFFKAHRAETEELVRRAHPEIANDYAEVTSKAHLLMMRAQTLARDMRRDLEAGVSESEIIKRLPKKLEPVYRQDLAEQRTAGGRVMGHGVKAREELNARWERKVTEAVRTQVGIEPELFEQWTGTDFAESLLNALMNPREKKEDPQKPTLPPPEENPEPTDGEGGDGDVGTEPKGLTVEEIEEPRKFAEYLLGRMEQYWRETKRLGQSQSINVWSDAVAFQFARKTAQNVFRKLVKSIVYSGARETAMRNIEKFDYAQTPAGLVSQMAFVGEIIHARHIRETKQQLIKKLDTFLKLHLGAQGRFKPDREELRRRVSAELELRARYMRRAMRMTEDAAQKETEQLVKDANKLIGKYSEAEKDVDQSRQYREIQRKLSILREFGALRYKTLGQIEDAINYWQDAANGSREQILNEIRDREIRTQKAAGVLAAAMTNPNADTAIEAGKEATLNNYFVGHMGFVSLLQDMIRHADGETRATAESIIRYIAREVQKAGDRANAEKMRQSQAFIEAVERIYGQPFRKVMAGMNERDDRFLPFMGLRGGKRVKPTKARAMQLLVSLLQAKKPGDDYFENAVKHDRHRQAPQISALLTAADMNMINWIGRWYEDNRQGLSEVAEALFGMGVYSENANYFPVKMLLEKQGLEAVEGVGWNVFPKALTPRVRNERDFDTSADIFGLWMDRMADAAQWKAHAKLGLEMRGIFGRSELQEAIAANHGNKANELVLEFITDILSGTASADRSNSGVEKAADWIRGWAALTALGANVGVTLKQTTSIPAFGFEIGLGNTARHILTAFTPQGMEAMRTIWNSDQRRVRWNQGSSEAVANALRNDDVGAVKKIFQAAMVTNKIGDAVPYLVVGQGIYRDLLEQGLSEEDAMAETWSIVERTQQSSRMENQPKMQRRSKLGRVLYQFLSTQQQYLQYEIRAVREVMAKPGSESAKKLARVLALNHFILTSLYFWMGQLYKMMLGQEPPEDVLKDWLVANLMGPFGSLFVLGFCGKATLERWLYGKRYGKAPDMIPMESFIKNQVADGSDLLEAIFDSDMTWEDVLDEAAQWASDSNAAVRDLRKLDKNYFRPDYYDQRTRERRRRAAERRRRGE